MHKNKPIYSALKEYSKQEVLRLHMPGHVGSKGLPDSNYKRIADIDITEIPDIGDWRIPEGAVEQARKLLSMAYGSRESLFLVNGASSGIHILFLALDDSKKKVLLPRNMHVSFYAGMVLSGVEPLYIPCQTSTEYVAGMSVRSEDIVDLLQKNEEIQTVFITSPNYFGITCDVEKICSSIKKFNKDVSVFVDEAHGGHFPFHDKYPKSAIQAGADAVVNGLHKTLPVLNQGACLHVQNKEFFWNKVWPAWSLLTTTSPSYPILASMDNARSLMMTQGQTILEKALELSDLYKQKINEIRGLSVFTEEELNNISGTSQIDPLKILINIRGISIKGDQVAQILRNKYAIQIEMSAPQYILAMMSMFHSKQDWENLYAALKEIARKYTGTGKQNEDIAVMPEPKVLLTPREAYTAESSSVDFNSCKGKISAEIIAPYPPGIPCLLPGELISENIYEYLKYLKERKIPLNGPSDSCLNKIKIIHH